MTIRDISSPQPSSREKHHHSIKAPSAGEGADRGEIKNLCSIQDKMVFKKTSGTLPNLIEQHNPHWINLANGLC
jgi:hypothetical protein